MNQQSKAVRAEDAITLLRRIKTRDLTIPGQDAEGDWYAEWQPDTNAAHVRLSSSRRLSRTETPSIVLKLAVAKFAVLKAEHSDVSEFHFRVKNEAAAVVLALEYAADGSERLVAA